MGKSSKYFKGAVATAVAVSGAVVGVPSFTEASTTFKDVSTKHNFYEAISNLAERGIIKGFEDGTFRPADSVTRGQAAKIIAGILQLDTDNVTNPGFKDIKPSHPYYGPIAALANAGIISGYEDNTYRSGETVQRNHMAKIIAGAFNLTASADYKTPLTDINKSYEQYITALHQYNVTTGVTETTFNGSANVTRGQLAAFVVRAENVTAPTASSEVEFTITNVTGTTVSASNTTYTVAPAIQALFASANKAALQNATVKAKIENGQITSVTSLQLNTAGKKGAALVFDGANAKIDGHLTINTDYIHVKNLQVAGNVVVTNTVLHSFEATAVKSTGQLRVEKVVATPTASLTNVANSTTGPAITLTNSTFKEVDIQRDHVALKSNTPLAAVTVSSIVSTIQIDADIAVLTINATDKLDIKGTGTFTQLTITNPNAKITLSPNVKITTLTIPSGKTVQEIIANYNEVSQNITTVKTATNGNSSGGSSGGGSSNNDRDDDDDDNDRDPKPEPEPEQPLSPIEQANLDITNALGQIGHTVTLLFNTPVNENTVTEAINKIIDTNKVTVTVKATSTANKFDVTVKDVKGLGTAKTIQVTVVAEKIVPQTLFTSADSVNINTPTTLPFKVSYNGTKENGLVLLKKGANGYEPFDNIYLYDKGDQQNADLLAGDGIYSANVTLNFSTPGVHEFAAGIFANGQWVAVSKPATILALQPLSTADAATVVAITNDVQEEIKKLKASATADSATIKQEIVKFLNANPEIVTAGTSETSDYVWYTLKSGALSAVSLAGTTASFARSASLNPVGLKALTVANTAQSTIGSQRVVIFSAHGQTEGAALAANFASSDIPFTVDVFENNKASVSRFKEMFNYGTIIFDTVGAALFKGEFEDADFPYLSELFNNDEEQVVLLTGEKVTEQSLIAYNADLQTGRLVTIDGYYAITPAFVKHYGAQKELNNALVYANNDYSLVNDTLATQFINNKAAAYVGYNNTSADTMTVTFNNLLSGKTLKDSVQDETIKGTESLIYSKEVKVTNGNFENGKYGWISGGHFDSITQLGLNENSKWATIQPAENKYMGIISSGVDDTALNGQASWVYQTFTVPTDINVLKFDYNVVSNEPMEYIHSGFDDTFKATIVEGKVKEPTTDDFTYNYDENGENLGIYGAPWLKVTEDEKETLIAYESINSSYWGKNYEDESQRVDVIFPDGDRTIFMTGWKTVTYDVSKFKGKTVTLKLQTWDLGDSIYPTAVLFDDVRFATAEPKALTIKGPKSIAVSTDKREYQFNALAADQFNQVITGDVSIRTNNLGYRQPVVAQAGTFSLKTPVAGASIDKDTGLLTVDNTVTATSLTIVAEGTLGKVELEVPVIQESFEDNSEYDELYVYIDEQVVNVSYSDEVMNYLNSNTLTDLTAVSVANSADPTLKLTINKNSIDSYGNGFHINLAEEKAPANANTIVISFANGSITLIKDTTGVWTFKK